MAVYESKNPTKDGRKYFFRIKYKDIFGEKHDYTSQKFKKKSDAIEEEAKYRIKVSNQNICTNNITIKQAWLELREEKAKKFKKQTLIRNDYLFRHLRLIENERINNIDLQKSRKLISYLESLDLTADYKNKVLELYRQIVNYSCKCYNTNDYFLKFVYNFRDNNIIKQEMLFFTFDEYKKFDSVINEFDFHTFFELLYFNGLRQGEAQALTWNDVDFEKNEIKITKTLTTKIKGEKWTISSPKTKNSIRILPLTKNLSEDLKTMKNEAKACVDYSDDWFVFGKSIPFKESTIQKKKNLYCKLGEVKQIRVHDFRHSCASLLINQGASIALVSKYLGHSNISITLNTYTHMYKSELENVTNLLNNL